MPKKPPKPSGLPYTITVDEPVAYGMHATARVTPPPPPGLFVHFMVIGDDGGLWLEETAIDSAGFATSVQAMMTPTWKGGHGSGSAYVNAGQWDSPQLSNVDTFDVTA